MPINKPLENEDNQVYVAPVDWKHEINNRNSDAIKAFYDRYAPLLYGQILNEIPKEEPACYLLVKVFDKIFDTINSYDPTQLGIFIWMLRMTKAEIKLYLHYHPVIILS